VSQDLAVNDRTLLIRTFIGKGTNFYSHLNIDSSASTAEINKAYRKKSLALQCVPRRYSQSSLTWTCQLDGRQTVANHLYSSVPTRTPASKTFKLGSRD
jgi:hypothetical protein